MSVLKFRASYLVAVIAQMMITFGIWTWSVRVPVYGVDRIPHHRLGRLQALPNIMFEFELFIVFAEFFVREIADRDNAVAAIG